MMRMDQAPEWPEYAAKVPGLEVVGGWLFHGKKFFAHQTASMRFFDEPILPDVDTNMRMPGMMPNPCAFLVRRIIVQGVSSAVAHGVVSLVIGNKEYANMPLILCSMKGRGLALPLPLFIAPLQYFNLRINWGRPVGLGVDAKGEDRFSMPLRVILAGEECRPIC